MLKRKSSFLYRFVALLMIAIFMIGLPATSVLAADKDTTNKNTTIPEEYEVASVETRIVSDESGTLKGKPSKDKDIGAASFTPGYRSVEHEIVYRNSYGQVLFVYRVRIYWDWGTTQINRVQTTPSGTTHFLGWQYNGTTMSGHYYDSNRSFYRFCQGDFTLTLYGQLIEQVRPTIEYAVHAGGGYHVKFNGGNWIYVGP